MGVAAREFSGPSMDAPAVWIPLRRQPDFVHVGARPAHIVGSIFAQLYRTVLAGLCVGVGGAALLSQLLRRELYGLSHLDPASYLATVAIFVAVAVLAALVPARRALRVDPMRALRSE